MKVNGTKNVKRKDEGQVASGKRARKQIQTLDFDENDELESISDGDSGTPKVKVNGKAGKAANGKPKRKSTPCRTRHD